MESVMYAIISRFQTSFLRMRCSPAVSGRCSTRLSGRSPSRDGDWCCVIIDSGGRCSDCAGSGRDYDHRSSSPVWNDCISTISQNRIFIRTALNSNRGLWCGSFLQFTCHDFCLWLWKATARSRSDLSLPLEKKLYVCLLCFSFCLSICE